MKRYLFIILALCAVGARAQTNPNQQPFKTTHGELQFTTPFYDAENQWSVVAKDPQKNKYLFGMVYLDNTAGYTFAAEGFFQVDAQGRVFRDSSDLIKNQRIVQRITGNAGKSAIIPNAMLADLKVPAVPDWLAIYQPIANRNTDAYKITHGRFLNGLKVPAKALEYLEPVYKINPHAPGLEFELSYAYNISGRYAEAEAVLKSGIAHAPDNGSLYAELGFVYIRTTKFTDAIEAFTKGLAIAKQKNDNFFRGTMATNLVLVYTELKQFDKAQAVIDDIIADIPPSASWYILKAVTYQKANDNENCAKAYIKSIELAPPQDMQGKAQTAYNLATLYRDKLNNLQQYTYWGKKSKEWAPANTAVAKAANALVFMGE
jgi:tetratricopeptide (TPR) repeat protein